MSADKIMKEHIEQCSHEWAEWRAADAARKQEIRRIVGELLDLVLGKEVNHEKSGQ